MAKKKKKSTKKKVSSSPQHSLPAGFWQQVAALVLIVISILLVVAWFGVGGPILEWIQTTALATIGYAVYVLPVLFVYVAVEIFRAERYKLPLVMKFATALLIVWFAGLFGLMKTGTLSHGGFVGDTANSAMLSLVESPIAALIYIVLILITVLFVVRVSPIVIIKKLWDLTRTEKFDDENVKVMRKAAAADIA